MRNLQATPAGTFCNRRHLTQVLAYAVVAASLGTGVSAWADTYGNNGGTSLSLPASWIDETVPANTGVAAPGAADIAAWDSNANLVAPTTFSLDVPTTWLGILIRNPGSGVTIGTGSNPLTLGASGIDMSAAVQNLTLNPASITLGANQSWNVGASATLTDAAPIDLGATNVLIVTGLGDKTINGVISDTGTLVKNGLGNLTLSAANTYTGGTVIGSGNLTLNFAAAGAPTSNILSSSGGLIFGGNSNGSLGGTFGNGHLIVNGSSTGPVTQTFSGLNISTGAASVDVNPGGGQTAQVIFSTAPVRTVNSGTVTATNVGGTIRFGTTGTITLPGNLSSPLLIDAGNNPYATYGLNDWAGTDANGNVIPVTYSTTAANGTNFDMIANTSVGAFTPNSVRFNNNATVGPLTLSISGNNTDTLRGILMTPNSVGVTIAGATAFARPNRVSTAGADFSFIQNSTAGDLTILPNLGNASSGAPVNIVKSGIGRLILGNAGNGYTGDTFINEGTIEISANGNLGAVATGSPVVFSGGTLQISASVGLFNGTAGTNNRNLQLNSGGGTLLVTSGTTLTVPGTVSGVGALTISGAGGTVNLGGANTNTGPVVVSSGKLLVTNTSGSATGTGAVSVASGASFGGNGIVTGDVTLASGAHLATGNGTALGTLTLGNLTLGSGSAADFSFSATGNSMANLTGSLNLQGGGIDLFQTGTTVPFSVNGTYTLFNLPSVPANFNTLSVLDTVPNVTYAFGSTGTAITVTITGGQTSTAWAVDNSGSWGVAGNWTQGIPQGAGDIATLGPVISAPRTVTLDGARIVGSLVLNNSNSYTVAQGTGGNLTLATSGTGVAAIADLLGNHLISAPVIFQSDTTVTATNATDSVTLSGPLSGAGNITTAGLGTVILTGADAATGTTTIAGGTLQVGSGGTTGALPSGNVINNASLVFNLTGGTTAAPLVIANNIAGPGKLTFNGNNVRQLSGTNTFTGPINLNAGTLQAGSATAFGAGSATNVLVMAAGSTLDLNGNSNTVGSLSGAGTIDNTGAANVTLTTGAANASPTFSGVIQNSGVGTLGLTKNGSGLLTLSGINTYTGGTVINAGGILITNGNAFGTGTIQANTATGPSVGAGSIQLSDGVTLSNPIATIGSGSNEILGIASGTATVASNITSIGSTQYRVGTAGGTLIMTGTSTVGIASSNTSLISILTRGNIVVAGTGSMTNLFQAMTIGRQSSTSTANLTIQDNAVVQGVGVTLGGLNGTNDDTSTTVTLSGNGLLSAGTGAFDLNNSNTTGSVTLNVTGNSTVAGSAFTQTGTNENSTVVTFDGGTLLATGGDTATVPFIAASTTEAAFVVSGVTVQNVYSPTINIGAGGMKVNDGGFAITIAAALTTGNGADGGLTKLGSGSLTLTGSNSYTGNTTVTSGGLFVNAAGATSNGAVILNGGTLGGNASITGPVVPGTAAHSINPGAAGPNSIGTLTLNGGLTTNANTTLAFDLGSPDTAASPNGTSDLLAIPGTVTLSAGKLAVTSQTTTGGPSLGYYEVLSYGTLVGSTHGIVLPAAVNNVLYTLDTTQNPGFIDIHRGFIGDANDDGKVDLTDLNAVLNNLGTSNSSWSKGNFDGAATIDLTDLNDVLNNLGTSIASGSSVVASVAAPEPASLGLLALGAAALIARRRKA